MLNAKGKHTMTKNEMLEQGLKLIEASSDKAITKAKLAEDFMALLKSYKSTKSAEKPEARPKTIEKDGQTYIWCTRHQQYELAEYFTPAKDGSYDAICDAGIKQWRKYSSEIARMEKMTITLIDDVDALREHVKAINELKSLRSQSGAAYDESKPTEGVLNS